MVKKQTYEELVPKWTILSGHPVAHIASHEFYPKFISIAEMAMRLQESLDMTSEKNLHKLSEAKGFKLDFPEGYQCYSKHGMINLFRDDGCKILEFWENLSYHSVGFGQLKSSILS